MHCIGDAKSHDFAVVYHPNNRVETHLFPCGHFCRSFRGDTCCACKPWEGTVKPVCGICASPYPKG